MTKSLLFSLVFLAAAFGAGTAPAQQPAQETPAPPSALTPAEAQRALDALQDPQKRDEVIKTLQAIAKAQPTAPAPEQPAAKPAPIVVAPNGLGAQLLDELSVGAQRLTEDAGAAVRAVTGFPMLWHWLRRAAADPEQRAAALVGLSQLALVFVGALLIERFAAAVMRRPIAALTAHAPKNGAAEGGDPWHTGSPNYRAGAWRLLRRLPFALARLIMDLIPVAIFVGIAGLLAGMVPDPTTRAVILELANAYAIARVLMSLGRLLVSPASGRLRLLHIANAQAEYLIRWLRRIAIVAVWGGALAEIALLLGLNPRADDTLMRLVALIVAAMLAVVVFRGRHTVERYLRARPHATGGFVRWRNWLAAIWHYLAIAAITAGWVLWASGIRNGIEGLRFLLGTAATLVAARLVAIVLLGILDRAADPSPELSRRFPALQARTARYHAPARVLILLLIAVATAVVLLQIWGANAFFWFAPGRVGAQLLSAFATIALAAFAAILVWEGANAALERRLALLSDPGSAAHAARLRTLLPMLRATLFTAIVTVVGLTALSEIGVNVAPLLAGAGIVGVAVGFGSQKLVQDVITGMFVLLENAIQVGDTVTVAGFSGTVEELSVRALWLRGGDGAVHIVPFSTVTSITNASRGLANAEVSVTMAAKEDTEKVICTLKDIAAEMRDDPAFSPLMLGDLEVWVDAVTGKGATLAGKIACTPAGRAAVGHEFNRRLQKRFQELGIELSAD